jgi:hypothetical protein
VQKENAKKLPESIIQTRIKKKLEGHGWLVVKILQCTLNGFPDLICFKNKQTVFIECKTISGKPSPLQLYRHEELRKQNFYVLILTDVSQIPESMLYRSG